MQRTQIYLDDELNQLLRSRAKIQGKGLSELIRQLLHQSLKQEKETAASFFKKIKPLESFSDVDPEKWVKEQRSKSRILR
ncbi:MAG TPA: ribbon-helix-helix protein, CopG family [Leucothrix sp.]|nr:ribbon-helix-helix protein, CopG family [Leucothrix sp.]